MEIGAWKTFDADEKSYGSVQTLIPLQTQNAVKPYKDLELQADNGTTCSCEMGFRLTSVGWALARLSKLKF